MWLWWTLMQKWEHVCTTNQYDVNDHCTLKVVWWLTREHNLSEGNRPTKNQHAEREIWIFQAIQLDFWHSQAWGIELHQMKLTQWGAQGSQSQRAEQCSVWPKWNIDILSENAVSSLRTQFFQVQAIKTSYILTNRQYFVGFQLQLLKDRWNFQNNLGNTAGSDFQNSLCKEWLQCITSVMQRLLQLQNHCCKIGNSFCQTLWIKIKVFPNALAFCCYIIIATVLSPGILKSRFTPSSAVAIKMPLNLLKIHLSVTFV